MTGCQRVFELLDTPVETTDVAEPVDLPEVRGEIRFENVSFGYERHRPVLKDVDFTIRPGEKIGIVGRSGSGKTTLVNLISRFYDVNEGRVLLDGVDVRQLAGAINSAATSASCCRSRFCFAARSGRTWSTACRAPRRSRPMAAAKAAQAHDFMLHSPLGYDTWLGERGAGLSGGERQRLSIARAILYDPPILVLDEATSSVDTESEKAIQQALRSAHQGPHHDCHRPSAHHAARRRPDPGVRSWAAHRTGLARPLAGRRWAVRAAGPPAVASIAGQISGRIVNRWANNARCGDR